MPKTPSPSVFRALRTRLFLWFLGAIVVAVALSVPIVGIARPEAATGGEVLARTVGEHLAETWDDVKATDAYLEEVRDVTGFELHLHRGLKGVPSAVNRVGTHGGVIVSAGPEQVYVPVVRGGHVVGALRMDRFGYRPRLTQWWRLSAALFAALAVLAIAAGRVSNLLARPLEQLGYAADRLGAGDLAFRTNLADIAKRGVAGVATEVRDVALAFNKMADHLEGMVRGQRELLAAISHELRSPLGRARIAVEIARDRVTEDDRAPLASPPAAPSASTRRSPVAQLDEIERQLKEVDAILGDLLAVTRAGLADLRKESLALLPWLRARLAEQPSPPPIELDLAIDAPDAPDAAHPAIDESTRVPADAALLGRALHNLVANARAHGHPDDAPIVVRVEKRGDMVAVLVRDRGSGFAVDLLPRVFEPFVRGDASRTRSNDGSGTGGSGLGLALVRRIAEAHGGEAFAANVDAGAEVGILLPLG